MDQSIEFSIAGYKSLVAKFINADYRFCDFTQENSNERVVIFRHDIDFSTQAALLAGCAIAAVGGESLDSLDDDMDFDDDL